MAEDTRRMQPAAPNAGDNAGAALGPGDPAQADESTPLPLDSDEASWESLGSTRVTGFDPPSPGPLPDLAATNSGASIPTDRQPIGKEPPNLGDFKLIEKIGEGAMGAVYRARQISFDRDVALKVLFPHIASNPKLVERLNREGQVMGRLDHPNIVQAYGVYEDQGWHFIALEFIECQSMQKWLEQLRRISLGDALHIVLRCARALDYAHKEGVVHRDIKPDNILISKDRNVKVADLGMVKIDDEDMALTQTGPAAGRPWYMPLEPAKNAKATDGRSDIYALGCMLYCFITASPPFAGKPLLDVIQAKDVGTFPPARQLNKDVPERLDLIITKMTAKLPKYRYQTCAELIQDLESLGLANPQLEFLTPKAGIAPAASPAVASQDRIRTTGVADPNIWYVRLKDADGKALVHKLTTADLQKMLAENALAPNIPASREEKRGYRAVA